MVDAAEGRDAPVPNELRLAWLSKQWGALPEAGGLYDQDFRTLYRMTAFNNIHTAVMRYRGSKGAQIHNLSIGERRIIAALIKDKFL